MREDKNKRLILIFDTMFFGLLTVAFSYLLWQLVICQTVYAEIPYEGYRSDILAYMQEMQGIDSGYPFPYPLFFMIGRFFMLFMGVDKAITWAEVLLNAGALIALKYYFEKLIRKNGEPKPWVHFVISILTVSCFLLSMWWLPRFGKIVLPLKSQAYRGTFSGNPWHNATYIATRPFAIVAFFSFVSLLEKYEEKIDIRDAVIFSVSLFLTTFTKPSFSLLLVSSAGLVMAFRLIKSRFSNFKNTMLLTLCFVPTFIDLLYEFGGVFGGGTAGGEHGIGFSFFSVWRIYADSVVAAIFYANAMSLVCFIWFIRDIKKDTLYRFTVILFVVSVLEAGLLYEKGPRSVDFNFCWGYMHGIFFFGIVTVIKLLEHILKKKKADLLTVVGCILFLTHLMAGIAYFKGMYFALDYETMLPCTWLMPQ